jgi:transcriptional regulator with XRE-family HTH domain/DNA-directed RNA polymerase specialized sigma24 family protein
MAGKIRSGSHSATGRLTRNARAHILRQLRARKLSMKEIAEGIGVSPSAVKKINLKHGVRFPEEAAAIGRAAALRSAAEERNARRINFFSAEKKEALLIEHDPAVRSVALRWFFGKSPTGRLLREEFGSHEGFVSAAKQVLQRYLDFYDPERVGPSGKKKPIRSWIMDGTRYFCMREASRLLRQSRRAGAAMPLDIEGRPIAQTAPLRRPEQFRQTSLKALVLSIRPAARSFLKGLGLNLGTVARFGFREVRSELLAVAADPATRLDERERRLVRLRLQRAMTLDEVAARLGKKSGEGKISREMARRIQGSATRKMLRRIGSMRRTWEAGK